jgi:cysteine desulfurase / selenocysteine lyase
MISMNYSYPALDISNYLNTSGIGLIPEEHIEAGNSYNQDLLKNGSVAFERWRAENLPRLREKVSKFVGCSKEELAFLPNFTLGLISLMPLLLSYKKVLLFKDDYPSLRDPFVLNDFDITWVSSEDGFYFDVELIKKLLLGNDIKLLAISHVQYLSGFKVDIEDLGNFCRQHEITFLVDSTQSLGRVPFSFSSSNIDILISSNYKWMNAGFGSGILCIRKEFLEKNPAKVAGYGSYIMESGQFYYEPSILSYEGGHLNCNGLNLLEAAIDQKNEIGLPNIIAKGDELLKALLDGLNNLNIEILGGASMDFRAGIACIPGTHKQHGYLKQNRVIVTFRNEFFRLGPHFYNDLEDIDSFISIMDRISRIS